MKKEKTFTAYSKKLCDYARIECWIMTFVYISSFIFTDKDMSTVCLASWGAYGIARAFYYNMAKSDHQIQLLKDIDKENANEIIKGDITDNLKSDLLESITEDIKNE